MTFGEKLKKLRTDSELTQDELAQALYVSRTAISKWESGRGYPNIESLKAISKQFSISIDDMLSGDEVISIAEQDQKQKKMRTKDILFGAFDCSEILLLFLPFFSQKIDGVICGTDLLNLTDIQPYLKITFFVTIILSEQRMPYLEKSGELEIINLSKVIVHENIQMALQKKVTVTSSETSKGSVSSNNTFFD